MHRTHRPRRTLPSLVVLSFLFVAACEGPEPSPMSAPFDHQPLFSLKDASTGGAAGFYFLPPLVANPSVGGVADLDRSPRVVICLKVGESCDDVVHTFSESEISQTDEHYQVDWKASESNVMTGETYRIQVLLGEVLLGTTDVDFASTGESRRAGRSDVVGVNRTVPIRFRIEEGAAFAAVKAATKTECDTDATVIACDVQTGDPESGEAVEAEVLDPANPGRTAGYVRVPAGATGQPFIIILKLLADEISGADFSGLDVVGGTPQIPYFLEAKVLDEDGNRVQFNPGFPAYLALCQPPEIGAGLIPFLSIFKVDSETGGTTIMDTSSNTPECTAETQHASILQGSLRERLGAGVQQVAGLLRARPLQALHGGLNTTMSQFSEFGAIQTEEIEELGPRIISPLAEELVTASPLLLKAVDLTAPNNSVQWALRFGTCAPGQAAVAGNVDGFSDGFSWNGGEFNATVHLENLPNLPDGDYCFVFNTTSGSAEGVRLTQWFEISGFGGDPGVAEITSPAVGAQTSLTPNEVLELRAADPTAPGNSVSWALRLGSCDGGTNIAGNVGGLSDPFTWGGGNFVADVPGSKFSTSGDYCFVFNTTSGSTGHRLTREFRVDLSEE